MLKYAESAHVDLPRFALSMSHKRYAPYGFIHENHLTTGQAFAGQWYEPASRCYPLGAGHRYYSPKLKRFIQPDRLSPFGRGGVNTYLYCQGDPVNRHDPSARFFESLRRFFRTLPSQQGLLPRPSATLSQRPVVNPPLGQTAVDQADISIASRATMAMVESGVITPEYGDVLTKFERFVSAPPSHLNVHRVTIGPADVVKQSIQHLRGSGPYTFGDRIDPD